MRDFGMPIAMIGLAGLCAAATASSASMAQQPPASPSADQAQEIVVTATRSGIPVWRVKSPTTAIVLVGAIEGVSKSTRWDPASLTEALRRSDRVMFPSMVGYTASPFALVGWLAKWKRMSSLPKGQSIAQYVPPAHYQRLVALRNRGILKAGFERTHPLHLAGQLRDFAKGKGGYGQNANSYVRRAVKKYKLNLAPIATAKAKPLVNDLFSSSPREHVPCLIDAIALAEAGPTAVKARSDAWAQRRVTEVLASPAEKVFESCWPADVRDSSAHIRTTLRGLLSQPDVTVAVLNLADLAGPRGILDDLSAAGFQVSGPRWK